MAKKTTAPEAESDLVLKRELFCQYITQDGDLFGNRVLSYAEAYGYKLEELSRDDAKFRGKGKKRVMVEPSSYDKAYHVCAVEGSRLLKFPEIKARIRVLLNELLKDNIVDARLAEHIIQTRDGELSLSGIKEYNKLRGRIIDKAEVTERFAIDDIRELLAPLPQERQDEIYAILTSAVAEAEALRSAAQVQEGRTQQP
jgi:hypothetical protein